MTQNIVKVAVIGFGYWGPNMVRNFNAQTNGQVLYVADFRKERLDVAQNLYPAIKTTQSPDEAIFDTEICNSSSIAINNNWIEVEPNSNINIIGAYEVVGGVETPINYIQSGGYTYIEAGSLAIAECKNIRFKVTFSNCNSETLIVKHGWDCSQYPLDYSAITRAFSTPADGREIRCYLRLIEDI
mgnify:CR=1 FL=1